MPQKSGCSPRRKTAPRAQPTTLAAMRSCASRAGPYIGGGTAGAATPWCRTRGDEGGMARPGIGLHIQPLGVLEMVRGKEERLPCKRQETDSTHGCPSKSSAFGAAPAELT